MDSLGLHEAAAFLHCHPEELRRRAHELERARGRQTKRALAAALAEVVPDFVIVDLEGTASLMVSNAIGMSDLVIIPIQGSSMDAKGGAKTIRLIRN